MGVTALHTFIKKHYHGAYIPIINNNIYEYIYLDMNFILHNSMYGSKNEKEFINKLYMHLNVIFSNFIGTKQIYFALDGPSSYAKIILQRKRRADASIKTNKSIISSLHITPGTNEIKKIEQHLINYINKLKTRYRFVNPETIISLSSEHDEGEVKICKKVIENGLNNLDHKHLIIGNDSDLIVLSMGMLPIYNINILVKNKGANELISFSKLLYLHSKQIDREDTILNLAKNDLRNDFVIISIMMGNDYLPKIGYINYENLWKIYNKLIKAIDSETNEKTLVKNNTIDLEIGRKLMYNIYNSLPDGFKKISINSYNEDRCKSYLEGLIWCLNMYNTGKCPKYDYMYQGKTSPHPYELLFYLCGEKDKINLIHTDSEPIPSAIYPLIVLPKKESHLIPKKYHKLMNKELKYLYEIEDCNICFKSRNGFKEINKQIKNESDDDKINDLKNKYKKEMSNYLTHKKTHKVFNINDIEYILKVSNNI